MRRRDAGLILLSTGVLCGIIYILIKLSAATTTATAISGLLMYTGIVAIIAGLIVFATSKARSLL
jgi:xanthosine utilization system XapX-like protein